MKRIMLLIFAAILCIVTGCSVSGQNTGSNDTAKSYTQISQEEAKEMMAKDDGHIVVDVRRQDEYDAGHILGAILIPNESIGTEQPEEFPGRFALHSAVLAFQHPVTGEKILLISRPAWADGIQDPVLLMDFD